MDAPILLVPTIHSMADDERIETSEEWRTVEEPVVEEEAKRPTVDPIVEHLVLPEQQGCAKQSVVCLEAPAVVDVGLSPKDIVVLREDDDGLNEEDESEREDPEESSLLPIETTESNPNDDGTTTKAITHRSKSSTTHRRRRCIRPQLFCLYPRARRVFRFLVRFSILGVVLLLLVLWLGAEYQESKVRQAGDTLHLYQQEQVCALSSKNGTLSLDTRDSDEEASFVAHCGACGACSNPHDIRLYDETKNTLYDDTVQCAKRGLVWGRKTADKCMQDRVDLTPACNDCWVDNILCDLKKCIFVCMWHGWFSQMDSTSGGGTTALNRCTLCDEKRCGPSFVACAGANRRRAGILSDIERDQEQEVCQSVQPEWWNDESLQELWRATSADTVEKDEPASPTARHHLRR